MTLETKATRIEVLTALRDRLAAATTGSFDLDKAILLALGFTWRGMAYWSADGTMWNGPANLSRSIDAAVTLAPKDFTAWRVGQGSIAWAVIGVGQYTINYRDFTAQAATPALALCLVRIEYELAVLAGRET